MRAGSIGAIALAVLLSAAVPCSGQIAARNLTVTPHGERVTVEGVEPFAEVALVGVIRRAFGTVAGHERWAGFATADAGGSVTIVLEREAEPDRSVWIAVEVSDPGMPWAMSQAVVGGTPLTAPTEIELPAGSEVWQLPGAKVEVLVARPGQLVAPTIWAGRVFDGGTLDRDSAAGSVGVVATSLEPVAGSSLELNGFTSTDILLAFEPESLQAWVARVAEGGQ